MSLFSPCNTVEPIVFCDTSAGSKLIKSKSNLMVTSNKSLHTIITQCGIYVIIFIVMCLLWQNMTYPELQ